MEHEHLDDESLEHLLALDRTEVQNRSLLHQIAVCPQCRKVGGWLLDLYRSGALRPLFGVADVALARSRAEATALWERLERLSQERRLGLARSTHTFASWGLAELLGRMSLEAASDNAGRAVELAELAVAVAESVEDDEPAESRWTYQLRALAWGTLANARRAAGDLPGGEQAVEMSDSWWVAGACHRSA